MGFHLSFCFNRPFFRTVLMTPTESKTGNTVGRIAIPPF
ncbi:hypothetical protein F0Z19_3149 [Vibrio cyclitrophicus]|nr:hypothetical protein F0Z19_3149 [Vibrio cyclitrophicus]